MRQILLEYSEIIKKMRQYPNGEQLAKLAHTDFIHNKVRPMADAPWTEISDIRKLPIGEIKRRDRNTYIFFANPENSLYVVANQSEYILFSVENGKLVSQKLNPKQITANHFRSIINDKLNGSPTKIYVDASSGSTAGKTKYSRERERQSDISPPIIANTRSAVEVLIQKIRPLVKNYLRQAIAEIRGDIMTKIKSGAIRSADIRIGKLRSLIDAYETLSFNVEDNLTLNIIKPPLANAFRIVAKKYYPDSSGHHTLSLTSNYGDYTYSTPVGDPERALINNIMILIYGYQQELEDEPLTSEEIKERQNLAKKQLSDLLYVFKKLILKI